MAPTVLTPARPVRSLGRRVRVNPEWCLPKAHHATLGEPGPGTNKPQTLWSQPT